MTYDQFLIKLRECIDEENFTPPHDLSFNLEIVLSFLERYYFTNKTPYLYSDALARTCKITKSQAMHICCEMRDAGLMDEYSEPYCPYCFRGRPYLEPILNKDEVKEYIENFECDNCEGRKAYVKLCYVFKEKWL